MALKEIELEDLVDALDEVESEYADFFRPMLGYEAIIKLYDGIDDDIEPMINEIEDEVGFEFPPDLLSLYVCTNGGEFGDLTLYPLTNDKTVEKNISSLNVFKKDLKESIGLSNDCLLIGEYADTGNYVTCALKEDGVYTYRLWDSNKKQITMEFEYVIQLIALEISYIVDYDGLVDIAQGNFEE